MIRRRKTQYIILDDAKNDLLNIRFFTLENWGKEQSSAYLNELKEIFSFLAQKPDIGHDRSHDLRRDIRSFAHRSHIIYYQKTAQGIAIIGVFHHAMLPSAHLVMREVTDSSIDP
ncbi:MAG: type II toxin-antitoxin system RelE/ParE family toxin [Synergistaceae bacterium]|jgi:toxin ParE1/3/4|nr:type II toxin-antitoxin system RelE/ParE family toxin [Synergistaceae bacterium]